MIGTAFKEPTHISEFPIASGYSPKSGDIVYLHANGVSDQINSSNHAIGVVAVLPANAKEPIKSIPLYIYGEVRVAPQSGSVGDTVDGLLITQRLGSEDVVMIK